MATKIQALSEKEIYFKIKECNIEASQLFAEWAENKIIIEKGENRHTDAECLHKAAENTLLSLESHNITDVDDDSEWVNVDIMHHSFRIKEPKELIYEWQWYWLDNGFKHISNHKMSESEANNFHIHRNFLFKDEETKGVRQ